MPDPLVPQCSAYHHGNDTRPPRWTGEACRHVPTRAAFASWRPPTVQPGNHVDSNSLSANRFSESVYIQFYAARGPLPSRMPRSKPGRSSRQITWSDRAPPVLLGPGSARPGRPRDGHNSRKTVSHTYRLMSGGVLYAQNNKRCATCSPEKSMKCIHCEHLVAKFFVS